MTNRWFLGSLVLFLASVAATAYVSVHRDTLLPEQVPTHWGYSGAPDQFTPRDRVAGYLWIMPAVLAGVMLLSRTLPWLSPAQYKIDTFRPTYEYIFFLITVMMVYLQAVILLAQMQVIGDIGRWMMGGLLILFGGMGNVMGKVQRNFYMGIRTPWTLASETVWIATHRMAAWTFVGGSLLGLVLLLTPLNPIVCLPLILIMALVPAFYSLWLYKRLEARGQLDKPPENGAVVQ
jgi:uncharacterized membrane protein